MIKIFAKTVVLSAKSAVSHDSLSITIGMVVASIGTFVSYLIGGCDYPLVMLFSFIILDYITGVLGGIKTRTINSDSMYWGLIRKLAEIIIVAIAVSVDRLMSNEILVIRLMVVYFYIGMEGISILENLVKLGVKVPLKLVKILEQIQSNETTNEQVRDDCNVQLDDFSIRKHNRKDE